MSAGIAVSRPKRACCIKSRHNEPLQRGAPHKGLAMLISRINCWISVGTAGRPRRRLDFQRQNKRKPARCHRTTVSGRTMASASRAFGNRWQAQRRTTLSTAKNGIRFGLPRRNTMICCSSTKTSASSAARDRNRSMINPKISLNSPTSNGGSSDSPPIANRIRFTTGTGDIPAPPAQVERRGAANGLRLI